ncbi:AsmA family protein [Pseudodesulfovibrio indicus]|uniref:AsmA protein n=1 Tax=Pseudodesulfovibrio indicus TaxID=1716143 RepID=A0A126QMV6_9BACT|nr:AsmA family protein [Pseudodesulfovibrio indicus]AMK11149.1 hypothetical protein AWY79_08490 [Pseudodesulfovibrio indicus]TDT92168.1 AsmA protein [Pseudodesulfovibrio indicus]
MKRTAKIILIGLVLCLCLLVVSVLVFTSLVDPNDYKDRIAKAVRDETGRTLAFGGDISLTLFPRLGVTLGPVSLSNAEGFGPEPMVSVRSALVSVRVLPLLLGQVRFDRLRLDGLVLNMGRDASGKGNWEDLVGRSDAAEGKEAGEDKDESRFPLEVAGVLVEDGSLVWDDRAANSRFVLKGVNASTGLIRPGALFPVELAMDFDCINPDAKGSLALKGQSSIDLRNREYTHKDMTVRVTAQGKAIPGGNAEAALSFKLLALDLIKDQARISGLECSAYGATLLVDGAVKGLTKGVSAASATVTLQPANLRTVLAALGEGAPDTGDAEALTRVGGTADISFETGRLEASNLDFEVDDTRVTGRVALEKGGEWPHVSARLDLGALDLDRYLPARRAEAASPKRDGGGGDPLDDTVLPADLLRKLHFDLDAKLARLQIRGAQLADVKVAARGADGLLSVDPLSAGAYGGTLEVTGSVDARRGAPVASSRTEVSQLNVAGLSHDVTGKSDYAGIANYSSELNAKGERLRDLQSTLNGTFSFSLSDGVFPGVDLARITRSAHSADKKQGRVEGAATDSTKFGSITGTGTVTDGVVRNNDLEVKAPGLRADGHGAFSLVTREIDYMVKAKLVPLADGQGGKSSGDLLGVMVPIHVTGTLEHPRYWVSLSEYAKALGGVVVDTVGTVLGGVKSVVKGVGSALDKTCCDEPEGSDKPAAKKKFLGIF